MKNLQQVFFKKINRQSTDQQEYDIMKVYRILSCCIYLNRYFTL